MIHLRLSAGRYITNLPARLGTFHVRTVPRTRTLAGRTRFSAFFLAFVVLAPHLARQHAWLTSFAARNGALVVAHQHDSALFYAPFVDATLQAFSASPGAFVTAF